MFKRLKEKISQEPVIFMVGRMWRFSEDSKREVIVMWVLSIFGRLTWMLEPFIFGLVLNEIQKNGVTSENLYHIFTLLFLIFFSAVSGWFFHGPSRVMERRLGYKVDRNYKKYLYNAVLSLPITWHSDHDSGDTIDKVDKATAAVFQFSRSTFVVLGVLVNIIVTTSVLVYFNVYVGFFAVLLLCLAIFILLQFDKTLIPQYKDINEFDNKAQAKVFDALSNVTSVKVLKIEDSILLGIKNAWWKSFSLYMKNKILVEKKWFTGGFVFDFLITASVVVYIYFDFINGKEILVGTISSLFMYLKNFENVYQNIAGTYDDITIQRSRVLGVKEIEENFIKLNKIKQKSFKDWKKISIENLNFSYNGDDRKVVDDLIFSFSSGEKVAIIGESGSGKSTLLKIIHGMYEGIFANVEVDNKKLNDFELAKLDIASALVPQEPEVFSASIKENLTLLSDFSDAEIKKATDMSMFSEVIENLPNKILSIINEKGVNLSGGQKQRLALARALLFSKNKKLILLDESTSSVDPINEVKIYHNIFENFKGATIFASIHKMNLLKYFDRILIMQEGKIVDEGSFEELLNKNLEFKNSWQEYTKNNYVTRTSTLENTLTI